MNRALPPNDPGPPRGKVFIVSLEEYGLFYLPGSHEIVSRLEPAQTLDRTSTRSSKSPED